MVPEPSYNASSASIVFTGASITSEFIWNGQCQTTINAKTIDNPASWTFYQNASTIDSEFGIEATSSFARYINVMGCSPLVDSESIIGGPKVVAIQKMITSASSPTITAPSITTTPLPQPIAEPSKPNLSLGAKTAIGISVPVAVLITLAILVLAILRHRKNKRTNQPSSAKTTASSTEDQPYLQQKGELEAKESALFELSAEHRQHELESRDEIREMSAVADWCDEGLCWRRELRGEEHCEELRGEEGYREME
ncbi:MAG: hypothetical protein Q9208_005213 [Pyrenodesmia sp. 3 TL-2023]